MAQPDADLASVAAFRDLGPELLASLKASLEPFAAGPGETLFRQNDAAEGMHVITCGRVRIHGRTLADGVTHLADMGAGEIIGEFGLVDQGRRSATAEALEPTTGFFMPREQFERLLFVGDPAAQALAREIRALACSRTRATLAAMAQEPPTSAELRAAHGAGAPVSRDDAGLAEMLAALHQFRGFRPAEAQALTAAGEALEAPRGAVLAEAGAPAGGAWIVIRGAVRTGFVRDGGIEQLLLHGPGKIVGGVAALDGQAQPARLDVREPALLLRLPQAQVEAWTGQPDLLGARLVDLATKQMVADLRALSRLRGRRRSMAALQGAREAAHV